MRHTLTQGGPMNAGLRNRRSPLTALADALLGKPIAVMHDGDSLIIGEITFRKPARARVSTTLATFNTRTRTWGASKRRENDGPAIAHVLGGRKLEVPVILAESRTARERNAEKARKGIIAATVEDGLAAQRRADKQRMLEIALKAGVANSWTGSV